MKRKAVEEIENKDKRIKLSEEDKETTIVEDVLKRIALWTSCNMIISTYIHESIEKEWVYSRYNIEYLKDYMKDNRKKDTIIHIDYSTRYFKNEENINRISYKMKIIGDDAPMYTKERYKRKMRLMRHNIEREKSRVYRFWLIKQIKFEQL